MLSRGRGLPHARNVVPSPQARTESHTAHGNLLPNVNPVLPPGEGHPFCPPDSGISVFSCPDQSTRVCKVNAREFLLATAPVPTCPDQA